MITKYLYYLVKKASERAHRPYYRTYYKKYIDACAASSERKPDRVMHREMRALKRYWGCMPTQYYRYKFWHRECPLTLEQMKTYIPDFFAFYLMYPLSFRDRNILCEDKRLMYGLNNGLGIPQPREVFNTRDSGLYDGQLNPITPTQAMERIGACGAASIFLKPTFGVGGRGIRVFERNGDGYADPSSGERLSAELLSALSAEDLLAEEGVVQHPLLNAIYPSSVNTFRIITECDGKKHAKVLLALLRMGSGGSRIDNASSGGLYIRVDPETGMLGDAALRDDHTAFTEHPDTGFRFGGYRMPMWEELTAFACSIALKYREMRYIGWDIAYTEQGPVVIEGNNGPGMGIIQDHYGGLRDTFGIDRPRRYWFREDFTLRND